MEEKRMFAVKNSREHYLKMIGTSRAFGSLQEALKFDTRAEADIWCAWGETVVELRRVAFVYHEMPTHPEDFSK